jgi:hypothetical protein
MIMENYIMLNGQKIDLTEAQVAEIERSFGVANVALAEIPVAETFKIGKYEFIVLEQFGDRTAVISKALLHENEKFGDNNNFIDSNIDKICAKFADEIENIIGNEKLIVHTVDLTSDDGLKCYGATERKMSLLTAEFYRRYVDTLDKHKVNKWWWLVTPYSTPKHDGDDWIKCVAPSGRIGSSRYDGNSGVRPFCILDSNIFVSK